MVSGLKSADGFYGWIIPAFQLSIAVLVLGFIFIVFAKPPMHPSLRVSSA